MGLNELATKMSPNSRITVEAQPKMAILGPHCGGSLQLSKLWCILLVTNFFFLLHVQPCDVVYSCNLHPPWRSWWVCMNDSNKTSPFSSIIFFSYSTVESTDQTGWHAYLSLSFLPLIVSMKESSTVGGLSLLQLILSSYIFFTCSSACPYFTGCTICR